MYEWEALIGSLYHVKILKVWEENGKKFIKIQFLDGYIQDEVFTFCVGDA